MKLLWSVVVLSGVMIACKTSTSTSAAGGRLESVAISKEVHVDWFCQDAKSTAADVTTALIYRDPSGTQVIIKSKTSSLQFHGEGELVSENSILKVKDFGSDDVALTFKRSGLTASGVSSKDEISFNCTPADTTTWDNFVGNGNALKCNDLNAANLELVVKKVSDNDYSITKTGNGSSVPFTGLSKSNADKGLVFGTKDVPKLLEMTIVKEFATYAAVLNEKSNKLQFSCVGSLSLL